MIPGTRTGVLPREVLQRELGVDSGLVASRVLPVPTLFEVDRYETVQDMAAVLARQELIAQACRDALAPEKRSEEVRLGVDLFRAPRSLDGTSFIFRF
ncbi:hypothetical protein M1D51_12815 [Arthrobacter sp. R3-55]